jgi:glycosyltransferase involved in cell wall biosynthesis
LKPKIVFVVTEDWYFCSHRLPLARAARDAGFDVAVITRVDRKGDSIRKEGFHLIHMDFRRGQLEPVRDVRLLYRLARIFRSERPALIHNVSMKPVVLGTIAARIAGGSSIVNALAGFGYVFASRSRRALMLRPLVKTAFRCLFRGERMRVIVQNPVDRDALTKIGVCTSIIDLIPGSGVDAERFRPTKENSGPPVAAMVSRMLWDKGVRELVGAARILQHRCPRLKVCLVGPPDPANPASIDEEELQAWVEEGVVEWLGAQNDIPAIWSRAQIAVLPSYREGLPLSLLEAAACGRAIVATDVPGCREVVEHEKTGLLVPPRDPYALADAIGRLAEDLELRKRLGNAARARVLERFTVGTIVEKTLSVYRGLCPGGVTA